MYVYMYVRMYDCIDVRIHVRRYSCMCVHVYAKRMFGRCLCVRNMTMYTDIPVFEYVFLCMYICQRLRAGQ